MSLDYLIDTDTFIYIKNHRPPQVLERFRSMEAGSASISVITYGELFRGCERSNFIQKNHEQLNLLIHSIPVQAMPIKAGAIYGKLRTDLERQGNIIGGNDLWIAAHALSLGLTLVTNNINEFSRVDGLKIENWV
jgi:tRNA(fMet)-specific endonuclease VapC